MKRERFSESEMVRTVKRLEAGESPMALCKELSIGKTTLYKWKSRYSGMEVSQFKRLKELGVNGCCHVNHILAAYKDA